MPAQTYFRTAAAELRKAVQEKRRDIEVLRKQVSDKEQSVRRYIEQLRQNQREKEGMATNSNIDGNQRVNLERAAQQDQSEVSDAQQALNRDKEIMRQAIDNLQREITNIEHSAREFETRS
jgi:chromosome segregation ATPase